MEKCTEAAHIANSVQTPNLTDQECGKNYHACFEYRKSYEEKFTTFMANKETIKGFTFQFPNPRFEKILFPKLRKFEAPEGMTAEAYLYFYFLRFG